MCEAIIVDTKLLSFEEFQGNRSVFDATMWRITIIGEAANRVSAEIYEQHAGFTLKPAISMRHRIVHGYDTVDDVSVYRVATLDIPNLLAELDKRGL
jgi:uncharacterized protein with HEPN domain